MMRCYRGATSSVSNTWAKLNIHWPIYKQVIYIEVDFKLEMKKGNKRDKMHVVAVVVKQFNIIQEQQLCHFR